jgi:ATP phosphoribosyltransferase regulatory subunit
VSNHTVEGTSDILFAECAFKRKIENNIMDSFRKYGYFEIETPTFEYDSVFSEFSSNGDLYRLIDRNGAVLCLRPDMTTPIARLAATKFGGNLTRASYRANVFRCQDPHKGGRQNEFTQCGIELLNKTGAEADGEVIAAAIDSLLSADVSESPGMAFIIELGDVNFLRGLLSASGLPEGKINQINRLMNSKDTLSIEEILKNETGISEKEKELFIKLPALFGNPSIIDELLKLDYLNEISKNALINLQNILTVIGYYGYEKYISIDLGMNKNMDYYTGMIFKIFTRNIGFPIAGGGRYDKLTANFGKNIPATGAAIYINRLLDAAASQATAPAPDEVIDGADMKKAVEKAQELRKQGKSVVIK